MATENKQVRRIEGTIASPAFTQVKQHKFDVGVDAVSGRDRTQHIYKDASTTEHVFITKEETEDLINESTVASGASPFVIASSASQFIDYMESPIEYNIFCINVEFDDIYTIDVISNKIIYINGRNGIISSAGFGVRFPSSSATNDINIEFLGNWDTSTASSFEVSGGYSGNPYTYSILFEYIDSEIIDSSSGYVNIDYIKQKEFYKIISDGVNVIYLTTSALSSGNSFVGFECGNLTLSGVGNTGFGEIALNSLTTGNDNTAVGESAGTALTTGYNNVMIGRDSGSNVTTGFNNIYIGAGVQGATAIISDELNIGNKIREYAGNSGIGDNTLSSITSAINNTAVGINTLSVATTNGYNTAIGANALTACTSGSNNIAIGSGAGSSLISGNTNILIGLNAQAPTTTSGSFLNIGGLITGYFGSSGGGNNVNINGTFSVGFLPTTGTGNPVYIDASGNMYENTSSSRFKENIEDVDFETSDVLNLEVKKYNRIGQEKPEYSPIAEQASEVNKVFANYDEDGVTPRGLQENTIMYAMLEEIKKLRAEVNELKAVK